MINQSGFDRASVYTDLGGMEELRRAARKDDPKALMAVAKQIESQFVQIMLKSMRQAGQHLREGNPFYSQDGQMYEDMLDKQMSLSMSNGKGVGLAEVLARQLAFQNPQIEVEDESMVNQASLPSSFPPINEKQNPGTPAASKQDGSAPVSELFHPRGLDFSQENIDRLLRQFDPASDTELDADAEEPVDFSSPQEFVEYMAPLAEKAAAELGVDSRVLLAQAALETGWGRHMIGGREAPSYNLFGIKSDQRWQGSETLDATHEYLNGKRTDQTEPFRAYESYQESFQDYVSFLKQNDRYQQALNRVQEPEQYARSLQEAGYATDPNYADKIMRIYRYPIIADASKWLSSR